MPDIPLRPEHAAELAELLQFLNAWLATDPDHLQASLAAFVGVPGYDLTCLRADLHRFTFLLTGDDSDELFDTT